MDLRMKRALCYSIGGILAAATSAQATETVSVAAFGGDPTRFLHHEMRLAKLGCFSSTGADVRCTSYNGVYVLARDISPSRLKKEIDDRCGGIVEEEDDPLCLFDAVFTPVAARRGKGVVIKGDHSVAKPVWILQAGTVTLTGTVERGNSIPESCWRTHGPMLQRSFSHSHQAGPQAMGLPGRTTRRPAQALPRPR